MNEILRSHKPTTGMQVASGITCECGYWTGDERAGVDRPVGIRGDGLDWHRSLLIGDLIRRAQAAQRETDAQVVEGLSEKSCSCGSNVRLGQPCYCAAGDLSRSAAAAIRAGE